MRLTIQRRFPHYYFYGKRKVSVLDLNAMSEDEFSILVRPRASQPVLQITVDESGRITLNNKLSAQLAAKPLELRFNPDFTAMQLSLLQETFDHFFAFGKNGRKTIPEAALLLKEARVPLPAVFRGSFCAGGQEWRGQRQPNPTTGPLPTTRKTKQK